MATIEGRPESGILPGRLTVDQQEVEVGESVMLSWDVPGIKAPDWFDRIGLFPAGMLQLRLHRA